MTPADITAGAHADYRECDYRFARQRADRLYVPLEKTAPVFVSRNDWLAGASLILFFIACFVVPAIITVARH